MNNDVMIDLETTDILPTSAILTIGAIRFNLFGNSSEADDFEELYIKVDLKSCLDIGMTMSANTMKWWSRQQPHIIKEAFEGNSRVHIENAMMSLEKFCFNADRIWGHGSVFDIIICENAYRMLGMPIPWKYVNIRDTRTIFDIGIDPNMPQTSSHHSLADAWKQAVGVQNVYKVLANYIEY